MGYKKAADGCAKKGKTKGVMMASGGSVAAAIKAHEKGSAAHRAGLKSGGMPNMMKKMRGGGRIK